MRTRIAAAMGGTGAALALAGLAIALPVEAVLIIAGVGLAFGATVVAE